MTKWNHKVSLPWLMARQQCLTATDVKDLLPVTKTGRPRKVGDEAYMKVFARKKVMLTANDTVSTGAAARGHILEPYAIDMYNRMLDGNLHHWDDIVVARPNHRFGQLAFSPDALDVKPEVRDESRPWYPWCMFENFNGPSELGEVKSYSAENHMARACTESKDLEERWQIAVAMAVCPTIEKAHILFYNPSMEMQLFDVNYTPRMLRDEIETVLQVEDDWLNWLANVDDAIVYPAVHGDRSREEEIVEEIIKQEALNPDGEKTVEL